jgi:protein tyrosine/serine phosphatase
MKRSCFFAFLQLTSLILFVLACSASEHEWATPVHISGLPNCYKVSEDLYRGAQPTSEGFGQLKTLGIGMIVNLRSLHSDKELNTSDLSCESIQIKAWHPEDEDILRFLKIATNRHNVPVFVHCEHGSDRTGVMCAIYRIVVCGWSKDEAIDEMINGGFGFHKIWTNLVEFVRNLDTKSLSRRLELEKELDFSR